VGGYLNEHDAKFDKTWLLFFWPKFQRFAADVRQRPFKVRENDDGRAVTVMSERAKRLAPCWAGSALCKSRSLLLLGP
jgi:hypothetical protein